MSNLYLEHRCRHQGKDSHQEDHGHRSPQEPLVAPMVVEEQVKQVKLKGEAEIPEHPRNDVKRLDEVDDVCKLQQCSGLKQVAEAYSPRNEHENHQLDIIPNAIILPFQGFSFLLILHHQSITAEEDERRDDIPSPIIAQVCKDVPRCFRRERERLLRSFRIEREFTLFDFCIYDMEKIVEANKYDGHSTHL